MKRQTHSAGLFARHLGIAIGALAVGITFSTLVAPAASADLIVYNNTNYQYEIGRGSSQIVEFADDKAESAHNYTTSAYSIRDTWFGDHEVWFLGVSQSAPTFNVGNWHGNNTADYAARA